MSVGMDRTEHAHAATGDPVAEALGLLRRAAAGSVAADVVNDLAVMLARTGLDDPARALLEAAVTLAPDHPHAAANLAALGGPAPRAAGEPAGRAAWRRPDLGGPDPALPERAFPGMPNALVMREHAIRYAWALGHLQGQRVLDLGCGTGYGTEMLTWVAASVAGFDLWRPEDAQRPVWPGGATLTYGHDLCRDPLPEADAAVAFEVVEHLADAPAALHLAWRAARTLIISFPNPVEHGSHHNPYHVNDWPLERVEAELVRAAAVRFDDVDVTHAHQDYRNGSGAMILPGRNPEASYWLLVATGR
jgi:SAM-dependent methyltransferase